MKEIKVTGSCSRGSDHLVHMHFTADNGLRIIELTFTPEQFANCITSLLTGDIEARIWNVYEDADKVLETKNEFLPWNEKTRVGYKDLDAARTLLYPYETDGWRGRVQDVMNHHNQTTNGVRVTFSRYVKRES